LGSVPLEPRLVTSGDSGKPFIAEEQEAPAAKALFEIIDKIMTAAKGMSS